MLGSVEAAGRWVWAVFGKHPLAGDYLTFGDRFPLGGGFAEWVKHGFKEACPHKEVVREMHSWRFWAKGHGRGSLVCGLVRDSFDSVGRPYPILLIGTGSLDDWERHWDLLPLACETTWVQMEYLSSQAFRDLKDFAGHVQRIAPPSAEWGECARRSGRMLESWAATDNPGSGWALEDMEREAASLSGRAEAMISLQRAPAAQQADVIGLLHRMWKARAPDAPNAVFMGGALDRTFLAFFRRPLTSRDFGLLWLRRAPETAA